MTLHDLNARFQYKPDSTQHGLKEKWTILRAPSGPLIGDCEDYALTALWIIKGKDDAQFHRSLETNEARIWFCHTPQGEAHAALEYGGRFIDNVQQTWLAQSEFVAKGYKFSHPMSCAEVNMRLAAGRNNKLPVVPMLTTAVKDKSKKAGLAVVALLVVAAVIWLAA